MRKIIVDENITAWFVAERDADLYTDNDELNIFEVSNKDYDSLNSAALKKIYLDSI